MNYLIAGLAKSGTTILYSRLQQALPPETSTYFEPDQDSQLAQVLLTEKHRDSLTKVLIGRVTAKNPLLHSFDKHVLIYRDPRDQFISMLLYLFYDFQLNGDHEGYRRARQALAEKVANPRAVSTIELYNLVAALVGRAPIAVFNNLHREQRDYIQTFSPFLFRYEDFIDGKLTGAEDYLSLSLRNNAEVANEYHRVARSRSYGEWRNWLNDQDLDYIQEAWGETLKTLDYPECPRAGALKISESTSLGYVTQYDPTLSLGDKRQEPG